MMCKPEDYIIIHLADETDIDIPLETCAVFFNDIKLQLNQFNKESKNRVDHFISEDRIVMSGSIIVRDKEKVKYTPQKFPRDISAYEKLVQSLNIVSVEFRNVSSIYTINYEQTWKGANSQQKNKIIDGKLYITFGR
jgi:hypothetical protein